MKLHNMTSDYAQALIDTGFEICKNIDGYAEACYNDNTIAELLAPVTNNETWNGIKMSKKALTEAHMQAIGYAIYQAIN